jgi:hypothetical protein
MAQYYFRVRDSGDLLPDGEEYQEMASLEDVRREAVSSAREILSESALNGKAATLDSQVEVYDVDGRLVLTVPVGHAVGSDSQS